MHQLADIARQCREQYMREEEQRVTSLLNSLEDTSHDLPKVQPEVHPKE